jgi:tetratricopeptide (TPR) repeat protein
MTQNNLGNALDLLGERQAGAEGMRSLAEALEVRRQLLEAAEALARADPRDFQTQSGLSMALYRFGQASEKLGNLAEARASYLRMLAVDESISQARPTDADARRGIAFDYDTLSGICRRLGDWRTAVDDAQQMIEHARAAQGLAAKEGRPFEWDFSISYERLARAQAGAGRLKEAVRSYEEAIKENPKSAAALNNLAWLLATSWDDDARDGKRAVELATKVCELTEFKRPLYLDTLAAACAEAGQFADAVAWQKKALEHPEGFSKEDVEAMRARLKLYEAGKPFHEPRPIASPAPEGGRPAR